MEEVWGVDSGFGDYFSIERWRCYSADRAMTEGWEGRRLDCKSHMENSVHMASYKVPLSGTFFFWFGRWEMGDEVPEDKSCPTPMLSPKNLSRNRQRQQQVPLRGMTNKKGKGETRKARAKQSDCPQFLDRF
jgi:hypothetical protein